MEDGATPREGCATMAILNSPSSIRIDFTNGSHA
jgi:hypothetical protein